MKKESLSIVFACALGALIGTLSALEISARFEYGSYFFGVGALFGGLVAYLAVDFQNLYAGITQSYHTSANRITEAYHNAITWEPYPLYWKATASSILGLGSLAISFALMAYVTHFSPEWLGLENGSLGDYLISIAEKCFYFVTVILITSMLFWPSSNKRVYWRRLDCSTKISYQEYLSGDMHYGLLVFKYGNPIVLPFFLLWLFAHMLCGIGEYFWENKARIINAITMLAYFFGKETRCFIVRTFIYVHSERRTLCFVDATLGAVVGFFFGSAIIGVAVGTVLGFVNYEIVSVRWLKLAPTKTE